jgi:hypothetical protein
MLSYVIVWENNTIGHKKVNGVTWGGHAAMNIGPLFEGENAYWGRNNYVSWWPDDCVGGFGLKNMVKKVFHRGQGSEVHLSLVTDIKEEEYLPDHVITLNTTNEQIENMQAEWNAIRQKQGAHYRALWKNCSTIVSRVLFAGGFHARKWALNNNVFWTLADIRKLVLAVGGQKMQWNSFVAQLKDSGGIAESDFGEVTRARSGTYCSTGAPCEFQLDG